MRLRKIIFVVLLLFVVFFIISRSNKADELNEASMANSNYCYDEKFDHEDSVLIAASELKKMKSLLVLKSNFRNDIKCFDYDNRGCLYLIKIDLLHDKAMDQFVWFREVSTSETSMHSYSNFSAGGKYDFLILGEKIPKVNKIIFSMTGDADRLQKNVYNKNFVSYYLPVSTFSLRYGEDTPTDIFFGGRMALLGGRDYYPIMISFYKKHKSLYIAILIPTKNEMNLDGNLFGKIMNSCEQL